MMLIVEERHERLVGEAGEIFNAQRTNQYVSN